MHVFCVGMYRACSTWQYEVASYLVERHRRGEGLGYLTGEEYAALVDQGRHCDSPSWKTVKSHEGSALFAKRLDSGQALALYSYRDLREVVYSLMHKRRLRFEDLLKQGMLHQLLVNDRFWRSRPGVLCQRYEQLVTDPVGGVEAIARFLRLNLEAGDAAEVADRFSLQANRLRTQEFARQLIARGVDLDDPSNTQLCDRRTLLHWNHLRDDRRKAWRDRATPDQRLVLDGLFGDWLERHQYEPDRNGERLRKARIVTPRCWGAVVRKNATIGRGWASCWLRELGTRWPRLAAVAKGMLPGLSRPSRTRLVPAWGRIRFDGPAVGPVPSSMMPLSNRTKLSPRPTARIVSGKSAPAPVAVTEFLEGSRARGFEGTPA
jgi:sulfotransferase family protein